MNIQQGTYDTNVIEGTPAMTGACDVEFKGEDNRLLFDEGVKLHKAVFQFKGSGSTIKIGKGVRVHRGCAFIVQHNCTISIGAGTDISSPSRLHAEAATQILLGEQCLLANVRFRTSDHHGIYDAETDACVNSPADIIIGDRVWLCEDVYVYKGVRIGSGSAIGGRSTVTHDLPSDSLCVGSPAKAVRSGIYWRR